MNNKSLCGTGAAGSFIAAICCFTPVLVVLLPAIGLATWLAWIDYALWPALALFLVLFGLGLYRWRREKQSGRSTGPAPRNEAGAAQ